MDSLTRNQISIEPSNFILNFIISKKQIYDFSSIRLILDKYSNHEIEKSQFLKNSYQGLLKLRTSRGLFRAAPGPAYVNHTWHRDSQYCALPFLYEKSRAFFIENNQIVRVSDLFTQTQHALMDRMIIEEHRIDNFIDKDGKTGEWERIHPKFSADNSDDVLFGPGAWGYIQNDAIGLTLFSLANGIKSGKENIIRNKKDIEIIEKLIKYCSISFFKDWDNGIWEEQTKLNTSSIVPCLSGLLNIKSVNQDINEIAKKVNLGRNFSLPENIDECINKGKEVLLKIFSQKDPNQLIPQESPYFKGTPELQRTYDLTLLSLIYPYGMADIDFAVKIVEGIEKNLLRENGVIRYIGDTYYNRANNFNKNQFDNYPEGINTDMLYHEKYNTNFSYENPIRGNEAEWCMGIPWLSIDHKIISDTYAANGNERLAEIHLEKANNYLKKSGQIMNENGLSELFFAGSEIPNVNNPLAWSNSMYIIAYKYLNNMIPENLTVKLIPDLKSFLKNYNVTREDLRVFSLV